MKPFNNLLFYLIIHILCWEVMSIEFLHGKKVWKKSSIIASSNLPILMIPISLCLSFCGICGSVANYCNIFFYPNGNGGIWAYLRMWHGIVSNKEALVNTEAFCYPLNNRKIFMFRLPLVVLGPNLGDQIVHSSRPWNSKHSHFFP